MLTIIIPNRNRNLRTVERTLSSIAPQCLQGVQVVVVDYGSTRKYQQELEHLVKNFDEVELLILPVQGQLWQKTRAINIVLKQCKTPYFMVSDMDMLFQPEFVKKALAMAQLNKVIFYQVGILTEEESKKQQSFEAYNIKFKTNEGATGITLFPTEVLKSIHGYDEFYHGWGAEDTDVHVRLQNAGYAVYFYNKECLFLHQWHPKHYRSIDSLEPFHPSLEKINHAYLKLTSTCKNSKANQAHQWGVIPDRHAYQQLEKPDITINLETTQEAVDALCYQLKESLMQGIVAIDCKPQSKGLQIKERLKKVLNKKTGNILDLEAVNERLLNTIVGSLRNRPYYYKFDRVKKHIFLCINNCKNT